VWGRGMDQLKEKLKDLNLGPRKEKKLGFQLRKRREVGQAKKGEKKKQTSKMGGELQWESLNYPNSGGGAKQQENRARV